MLSILACAIWHTQRRNQEFPLGGARPGIEEKNFRIPLSTAYCEPRRAAFEGWRPQFEPRRADFEACGPHFWAWELKTGDKKFFSWALGDGAGPPGPPPGCASGRDKSFG